MLKKLLLILGFVLIIKSVNACDQNVEQVKVCTDFSIYCQSDVQRNKLKDALKDIEWLKDFFHPPVEIRDEKEGFRVSYSRKFRHLSFEDIFYCLWPVVHKLGLNSSAFSSRSVLIEGD